MASIKSFIIGFFGFIVAMLVYVIIAAQYSDYIAETQISSWCMDAQETIKEINYRVSKTGDLSGITNLQPVKLSANIKVKTNLITPNGAIIIQGGHKNQLLVLNPTFNKTGISWQAYMSPVKSIPHQCKSLPSLTESN